MKINRKIIMTSAEVKSELTKILNEFVKFCKENNLRYSLDGGTLIGAIRHGGFIPWDDDIDVMMPRDDYEKFMKLYKSDNFHTLNFNNNRFYHLPIGKLISTRTWGYEKKYKKYRKYGVYLDIFPLDFIPEKEQIFYEKMFYNKRIADKCSIIASKYFFAYDYLISKKSIVKNILLIPLSLLRAFYYRCIVGFRPLLNKCEKKQKITQLNKSIIHSNDNIIYSSKKVAFMYWGDYTYKMSFDIDDFNENHKLEFEGIQCNVIKNYKIYLDEFYGNYMKLPPIEERISKHMSIFYWRKCIKNEQPNN